MTDGTHDTEHDHLLVRLGDSKVLLSHPAGDIRGRTVHDVNGNEIGLVAELLVDRAEGHVRFMEIQSGGFFGMGGRTYLMPIDAVTGIDPEVVHVDQTGEHTAAAPAYDPEVVMTPDRGAFEAYYGHFGFRPYWSKDYAYPDLPYQEGGISDPRDDDRRA